ncbi:PilZ domain-containing protein [Sphingomonas donggukensis]|uniref:PilZ domain-containing protein n=1 Tax=Sphingomonas donggukensis TaxID=2949093 RepID=A0ABY4U0T3_9SPHN|nr:PilZ domain-containing protein [Sphingomonas donggukensis]URW76386.1 PilZ domain-containing protein [Sphingomonas donggukensis]
MDQPPRDQFAIGTAGDASARGKPRDSLMLTAMLTVPAMSAPVQVRVRNLSAGGLMAEYAGPATTGDAVTIALRGVGEVAGSIAWVAEGRVGVAFDTAIDPLLARKPVAVRPRAAVRPKLSPL